MISRISHKLTVGWILQGQTARRAAAALIGVVLAMVLGTAPALGFAATEGVQFSGQIAALMIVCHPNSGGDTFNCAALSQTETATIDWGDGTTTSGTASKDGNSDDCFSSTSGTATCRYLIFGTHTYADEGSQSVTFSAPNVNGPPSNNPARGATTASINDAVLTNSTGATSLTATEGAPASLTLGSFTDQNPGGAPGDFTAMIDWGDGTAVTSGAVSGSALGGFSVSGVHTFAHAGSPGVTVTIQDKGTSTTSFSTTVTVADAALTDAPATGLTATEGAPRALTLAHFSDADPGATAGNYIATVHWGDGATGSATVASSPRGGFAVSASHAYGEEGVKRGSVTVQDVGGASISAEFSIRVTDAGLALHPRQAHGRAGHRFRGRLAWFTDADPGGAAADYRVAINWGDGTSPTRGSVSPNQSGGFNVTGRHTYVRAGAYSLKITITDAGGASAVKSEQVTIALAAVGDVPSGA